MSERTKAEPTEIDGGCECGALGTMHGDPGISPRVRIHVASKAPWHELTDDLPQFSELPD